ncbi:MAG: PEGA domain-containing protein [Deltaproteobacteria bacterium]|nr:PEGA domain-containing protein [Deltaproteobacteria bacterium]
MRADGALRGGRWTLFLVALLALILPLAAPAQERGPIALGALGEDAKAPDALKGARTGLKDAGFALRPPRQVTAAAGAPLAALAAACAGRAACYDGIAKSVEGEVWLLDIVRGEYVMQVVLHRGLPGGGGGSSQLTIFNEGEVEAAAYGLVVEAGKLEAKGKLSITSQPEGADVRISGQLIGQTPVKGFVAKAGAVRVDVESKGFEDVSRLVLLQPGAEVSLEHTLEVKLDEIPLADLDEPAVDATAPTGGEAAITTISDLSPTEAARMALPPLASTTVTPERKSIRLPTWFAAGLGVVALGGGAYFGMNANSQVKSARAETVQLQVQSFNEAAQSSAMKANVFFGVGAAAMGTATYLLIRDLSR